MLCGFVGKVANSDVQLLLEVNYCEKLNIENVGRISKVDSRERLTIENG